MSNQKSLKEEIKEGRGKFKELSFSAKIGYIKDYYSIHILAVVILIIAVFAIYRTYQEQNFETVLYTVLINNDKSVWDEDEDKYSKGLSDPFEAYLGIDGKQKRVVVDNSYILDYDKDAEMSVYSAESLVAMFYGSHIDVHVGNRLSLDYFCQDNDCFFYDLREIFDEEFLKRHEDRIEYCTFTDGTQIPIAFDISNSKIAQESEITVSPPLIAVFFNTKRLDTAVEYIRFILDEL